jgi:DNA repair protein RecN (Recombination protein N)
MLQSLAIKNFALIDTLKVDFTKGLSIITGETGAGKSILLGGLALVLGKRADLSSLKDKEKKCIIEAEFSIQNYNLEFFFKDNDLDYEPLTIIRREILPSGKSRAFINDTPLTLNILNRLSERLIDVHSQHQTLQLGDVGYQFYLIDSLALNKKYLDSYARGLKILKTLKKELSEILSDQEQAKQQYDYNFFLFEELEKADFQLGEQAELEQKIDQLNNVEQIKESLSESLSITHAEEKGLLDILAKVKSSLIKISDFSPEYQALYQRIESLKIELDDIAIELENQNDKIESNPFELEKYNDRLQLLYDLQKKHQVSSIEELHQVFEQLDLKVQNVQNAEEIIQLKNKEIDEVSNNLNALAKKIHNNRTKAIPKFVKQLEKMLANLEMPSVKFKIDITLTNNFYANGKDDLSFLISTNKGGDFIPIKKGPSGGEMSRIMLAVKSILSSYIELPTIIFDEIDTGVSGEVSNRIADVMLKMSENMQVISITHLPQIAAKGSQHYKVYKTEVNKQVETNIKQLTQEERLIEIAEMLGGKQITESALAHAEQLLK